MRALIGLMLVSVLLPSCAVAQKPAPKWLAEQRERKAAESAEAERSRAEYHRRLEEQREQDAAAQRQHERKAREREEARRAEEKRQADERALAEAVLAFVARAAVQEIVSGELCRRSDLAATLKNELAREKRVAQRAGPRAAPSHHLLEVAERIEANDEFMTTLRDGLRGLGAKPLPCTGLVAELWHCSFGECTERAAVLFTSLPMTLAWMVYGEDHAARAAANLEPALTAQAEAAANALVQQARAGRP